MRGEAVFRRRTARILALVAGVTLAVTLLYVIFGDPAVEVDSAGADAFSRSALGYRALLEILEREVPVIVSRSHSESKASPTSPLLLLEPPAGSTQLERLAAMIDHVRGRGIPTVVVLPKWRGYRGSGDRRGWIRSVELRSIDEPRRVLETVLGNSALGQMVRKEGAVPPQGLPALPVPQLLRSDVLETVAGGADGALVVRLSGTEIYVVSDPDLLNTAGLARPGSAAFAHRLLIDRFSPQAFVVDEVLHGFGRSATIWRALVEFPLICATLHLAALLGLALWASTARFGRPLPPPSRLPPGKMTLIENTARLLALAERSKYAVERYLRLVVGQASRRLALPPMTLRQQVVRLTEMSRNRGVAEDLDQLAWEVARLGADGVDPRRALELSRALYRWRKELTGTLSG